MKKLLGGIAVLLSLGSIRAFVTFSRRCDDAAVPDGMKISRKAHENYRVVIPTMIVIV